MKTQRRNRIGIFLVFMLCACVFIMGGNCQQSKSDSVVNKENLSKQGSVNKQPEPPGMDIAEGNEQTENNGSEEIVEDDSGPPPKAVFTETKFDVGELEQGEDIEHTFMVKNTGPGVLRILSAKPS